MKTKIPYALPLNIIGFLAAFNAFSYADYTYAVTNTDTSVIAVLCTAFFISLTFWIHSGRRTEKNTLDRRIHEFASMAPNCVIDEIIKKRLDSGVKADWNIGYQINKTQWSELIIQTMEMQSVSNETNVYMDKLMSDGEFSDIADVAYNVILPFLEVKNQLKEDSPSETDNEYDFTFDETFNIDFLEEPESLNPRQVTELISMNGTH